MKYSENLPVDFVIEESKPYLGKVYSGAVNWSPKSTQFTEMEIGPENTGI